jgi:bifunctional ADP-heptose synthase (sugar kinase/adenylyltransferase)
MLADKKILLLGDAAIDRYHWGRRRDHNPESPVPILDLMRSEDRPGMAANVRENLAAFGFRDVVFLTGGTPSIKHRYMDIQSRQCLIRIDQDAVGNRVQLPTELDCYDVVVISDYGKGSIDIELVTELRCSYAGKILIDTKIRDLAKLQGCTVKINLREWQQRTSDHDDVIVTMGEHGASYHGTVYPTEPVELPDVCGAGDAFLAGVAAGWLLWNDCHRAIRLALDAGSRAVRHQGTWSLTTQDAQELCAY